jgi:tRNA(adenine34) deaminase
MCAGAILMAQLDACFFAAADPLQGCCGSVYHIPQDPAFTHRVRVVGGILEEEAKELLKDFFAARRVNPS